MKKFRFVPHLIFVIFIVFSVQACSSLQQIVQGTPTPLPTNTPMPPTSTSTPTITPTADIATQQYEAFQPVVKKYYDGGYIESKKGEYHKLDDYSDSLAQQGNYQWASLGMDFLNFIMKSHVTLTTDGGPAKLSGCGISFRSILDYTDVVFAQQSGNAFYAANNETFDGENFGEVSNPGEMDFVLIVNDHKVNLFIDQIHALEYTIWPLSEVYSGDLGFAVISGSSSGYGTRCDFTDNELWIIK